MYKKTAVSAFLIFTITSCAYAQEYYYLLKYRNNNDLEKIKSIAQVLNISADTTFVKMDEKNVFSAAISGVPIKRVTENYFNKQAGLKSLSAGFSSDIKTFSNVDQSSVTEMLSKITKVEISSYITILQNFNTRYFRSAQCNVAKDYLVQEFKSFGLDVSTQSFMNYGTLNYNVLAVKPGKYMPEKICVISAHYDSTSDDYLVNAPGADDNATGVAAVLLAAKYLSAYEFSYTIVFACFSGEEQGLIGSEAYARNLYNQNTQVIADINVDMIGYYTQGIKYDLNLTTNRNSQQLVEFISQVNDTYVQMPLDINVNDYAWWSDHSSFWDFGYNAVEFCEAYDWGSPDFNSTNYHTTHDTLDKLDLDFTLKNTLVAVASVAELADLYVAELSVLQPAGWVETVTRGETYLIKWENADTEQVSLYYSDSFQGTQKLIATVNGALKSYSWNTSGVVSGRYWLCLKTQSGAEDWSSGQLVILSNNFESFIIYPNPARTEATFSGLPPFTNIKVYNLAGELLINRTTQNQFSFTWNLVSDNHGRAGTGVYLCVLENSIGDKHICKLAITK